MINSSRFQCAVVGLIDLNTGIIQECFGEIADAASDRCC